jgi:hypothetical protein
MGNHPIVSVNFRSGASWCTPDLFKVVAEHAPPFFASLNLTPIPIKKKLQSYLQRNLVPHCMFLVERIQLTITEEE